jgi:hypothetical protein
MLRATAGVFLDQVLGHNLSLSGMTYIDVWTGAKVVKIFSNKIIHFETNILVVMNNCFAVIIYAT